MTLSMCFFWNSIIVAITVAVLIFLKHCLKQFTSPHFQYYIWLVLLLILVLPFTNLHFSGAEPSVMTSSWKKATSVWNHTVSGNDTSNDTLNRINDDLANSSSSNDNSIDVLLYGLFLTGCILMTCYFLFGVYGRHRLKKQSTPCNDATAILFAQCKQELHIRRAITLYCSDQIVSPLTYGPFRPCVLIPASLPDQMNESQMRCILYHELEHCKKGDLLINALFHIIQILYWYHPCVWYAKRKLRIDCEIACDASVLTKLSGITPNEYGMTILTFATHYVKKKRVSPALELLGSKKYLTKRITHIASYKRLSQLEQCKNLLCLLITGCILLFTMPITSLYAANTATYDLKASNIHYIRKLPEMDGYSGSFVLYNAKEEEYQIYNKTKSTTRISPDSTYKIYSSLCALENGIITTKDNTLKWNQEYYSNANWNKDQDLTSALHNSVNWYFESLDQSIGSSTLNHFYKNIHYGNEDLSGGITSFWKENSLKISPVEQVELLQQLHTRTLPAHEANMDYVEQSLYIGTMQGDMKLYGKTGTGGVNGKLTNGWFIGYVTSTSNTYYFALNINNSTKCSGANAYRLALEILNQLEIS